jgi:hypothetical protein
MKTSEFKTAQACTLSFAFCVGVRANEKVEVIDTKNMDGSVLTFSKEEWRAFVQGVKNGEFDV